MDNLQLSHSDLAEKHDGFVRDIHMGRLSIYQANLLTRMIDILYEKKGLRLPEGQGNDASRSSRRYAEAARRIRQEHFERNIGLPLKYHDVLKKYSKI